MFDTFSRKAEYAGVLLYTLGNLTFTPQLTDVKFTAQLMQHIAADKQTNLLSEATEKCRHCPHSNSCDVGALFKD